MVILRYLEFIKYIIPKFTIYFLKFILYHIYVYTNFDSKLNKLLIKLKS
jgi:hypothetical protein